MNEKETIPPIKKGGRLSNEVNEKERVMQYLNEHTRKNV